MGCIPEITENTYPVQGKFLGAKVKVMFHFTGNQFDGVIVRDDIAEPFVTILSLNDGRYVLSTECQYMAISLKSSED